ncbi:lipoprotein [Uliginosibacterium sp. IMCC34675]|uniref:Lipoprotein n=2 Tax=Uliginosibacterium aquaticum TaxID=2731212 RepID=A0ABX2IN49_9RHOO|nr:lipoprotein [Uliginosibacterium aquaticum]
MNMNRTLCLLGAILLLAACSKITADNYAKLHAGMSLAEISAILGQPGQCSEVLLLKQCRWGDDKHYIAVSFAADAAVSLSGQGL